MPRGIDATVIEYYAQSFIPLVSKMNITEQLLFITVDLGSYIRSCWFSPSVSFVRLQSSES